MKSLNILQVNYEVFEFYKLFAGNHPKNCLFQVVFMFFSFRVNKSAKLIAIIWLKKGSDSDLRHLSERSDHFKVFRI